MSEPKHTPGPWKWEAITARDDGNDIFHLVDSADAVGGRCDELCCVDPDHPDMKLIASAPTMADELRGVREWLRSGGNRMPQQWEIDHAITRISNALSEAGVEG